MVMFGGDGGGGGSGGGDRDGCLAGATADVSARWTTKEVPRSNKWAGIMVSGARKK